MLVAAAIAADRQYRTISYVRMIGANSFVQQLITVPVLVCNCLDHWRP